MSALRQRLQGHTKDLGGGMLVRRLLPAAQQRSVGPFVFFYHFGPVTVQPTDNHDVRPHPHIGLATVTYLFEGAMQHHDSLGFNQLIEPGAINLMVAGRGIVHSERRPLALRSATYVNHGLQLWLALPQALEEAEPAFHHAPAHIIPSLVQDGVQIRVLMGLALGQKSPVPALGAALYLDVALPLGARWTFNEAVDQLAVYAVDEPVWLNGERLDPQTMAVVEPGQPLVLTRESAAGAGEGAHKGRDGVARVMLLGGAALDAPRHMWWNFVSSRKQRIVQAAQDWRAQRMGHIAGETEFIPLPEPGPQA